MGIRLGDDANRLPLTRLSHIDAQLFGLNSGLHHVTNLLLHAVSTLLLLAVLRQATEALAYLSK
jgi:hypothetical protein